MLLNIIQITLNMKLKTIKKYLFNEINLLTDKKCKPAQNSILLLMFSEHKKYRKPFNGLNFYRKRCNFYDTPEACELMAEHFWEFEKYEWFQLMILINELPLEYSGVPFKLKAYANAYCDWFKRNLPELWEDYKEAHE